MADICVGLLIIGSLSAACFAAGRATGRAVSGRMVALIVALAVAAMFAYSRLIWQNVAIARLLPFSNLIVVGNWYLLLAGFLAGLIWSNGPGGRLRRGISACGLIGVGGYALVAPLLGSPPECGNRWMDGICLQTTEHTCAPASAATLLRLHGIAASEGEMARLCLTRHGTTWQGLYRGLKQKTAGTGWDVEVVSCPAAELLRSAPGPMIVMAGLEAGDHRSATYREEGWIPGVGHSLVLLGVSPSGQVEVADPMPEIRRECWSRRDFERLWRNCGMRLVRR